MKQDSNRSDSLEEKYEFLKNQFKNLLEGKSIVQSELFNDDINHSIQKNQKRKDSIKQNEEKYRFLFENMNQGHALHEVICDDSGKVVDYTTLLANEKYEEYLNVSKEKIIGKKISEILPKKELNKWIKIFGEVALSGTSKNYSLYSEFYKKHFEGIAYCPGKGKFAVSFSDVTDQKQLEEVAKQQSFLLKFINSIAIPSADKSTVDELSKILLKAVKEYTGAVLAAFSYYQSDKKELELLHVEADQKMLKSILKIVGDDITKIKSPVDSETYNLIIKDVVGKYNNFNEVSFGAIPKLVDKAIRASTGIDCLLPIVHVVDGELFGSTMLAFKKGQAHPSTELLESFAHLMSVSLKRYKAEKALKDSEERFKLFVNQSPTPIAIIDNKMEQILYWSESATQKLGHTPKTLPEWFTVAYPDPHYRKEVIEHWTPMAQKAAKTQEATNTGEYEVTCKDGSVITAEFYVQFLPDQIILTLNDITERKNNEEAIRQSEENLKLIVENGTNLYYRHDVNHRLKYVSPQIKNILGYEVEEAKRMWTEFATDNPINEIGFKNTVKAIETGERQNVYDLELRHKNGNKVLVEVREAPIVKNGKTVEIVGALADVTEKRKTENALRESEMKFRSTFDQSPVSSVIVGLDKRFIRCNASFCNFLGYSENEIIGHTIAEYTHPDDIEIGMKELQQLVNRSIESTNLQKRYIRKNGDTVWGEISFRVVFDNQQNPLYFLPVIQDITKRKQIEQDLIIAKEKAEESDRLKSAFLANMSHEIRTPMNGILGFANLLKEPQLSGSQQQNYIEIIQESGERMLNTVNDIIEISKIETGLVTTALERVNVNKHFSTLYHFFKLEADKKGLELVIDKQLPEEDCRTLVDKSKFSSILTNLIKNAIKFTYKGTISFGCEKKDEFLEFYVKDTGVGIPQNKLEAVFNRFEQADIKDTRVFEGSGLGLTISKSYVEMLGGTIWIESSEGTGSTFFFTIPYKKPKPPKIGISKSEKPAIDKNKKRVFLIAEDDEVSKMHLSLLLKDTAKSIIDVSNGLDAVETVRNNSHIDIVLMDIRMPKMNGMEATQKIREFNKEIVIIAQTAFALEGDREKMLDAGCTDYISKPINKVKLLALIEKYA